MHGPVKPTLCTAARRAVHRLVKQKSRQEKTAIGAHRPSIMLGLCVSRYGRPRHSALSLEVMNTIAIFILGLLAWTFIEYVIHGWLSHTFSTFVTPIPDVHHRDPHAIFTIGAWL